MMVDSAINESDLSDEDLQEPQSQKSLKEDLINVNTIHNTVNKKSSCLTNFS